MGLVDPKTSPLSARNPAEPDWSENPTKDWDARAMAVHAAMIDRVDQGIGRLIAKLKETGELDNTLICVLSDNGASPETPGRPGFDRMSETREGEAVRYFGDEPDKKTVMPGPETTYAGIGPHWANVANTPLRYWKATQHEGGIRTPLIVHWPAGLAAEPGAMTNQPGHVIDLMATVLDVAGVDYPDTRQDRTLKPLEGKSLVPVFKGRRRDGHEAIFFEHYDARAMRRGDWKLVATGGVPALIAIQPIDELTVGRDSRSNVGNYGGDFSFGGEIESVRVTLGPAVPPGEARWRGHDAQGPNVVLVLADDQGWANTSVQMSPTHPDSKSDFYRTPHLERLAREGMRFSNAYASHPNCSPTRLAIQTGKTPAQLRMTDIVGRNRGPFYEGNPLIPPRHINAIPDEAVTIAELITTAKPGYATAHFGKWHRRGGGPGKHGYDANDVDPSRPLEARSLLPDRRRAVIRSGGRPGRDAERGRCSTPESGRAQSGPGRLPEGDRRTAAPRQPG